VLGILSLLTDVGFHLPIYFQPVFIGIYIFAVVAGFIGTIVRYLFKQRLPRLKVLLIDGISYSIIVAIIYNHILDTDLHANTILNDNLWIRISVVFTFIREFSEKKIKYSRAMLNPAQLFILSFMGIILLGTFLLLLPKSTIAGIGLLDALFTSTSAVCITGLVVVDTDTHFTSFGQFIIMMLMQIGGLGILTFASYFSYFFKGGATYENQLALSDITSSNKIGEVFSTLKYIILITAIIELFAATLIFLSVSSTHFNGIMEHVFFAMFHAVSAFCNGGFSTLGNSLYDQTFRFNYAFQLVIIITFILGGLGFPIVVNLLKYIKYQIFKLFSVAKSSRIYKPWVLNLNSRIALFTTLVLVLVGFLFMLINEYNNTLAEHNGFGKIVTALFSATTPRSGGFNTVDIASLHFSSLMLVILLMWIGASPISTGGGIKTTTFAVATLNILSLAKGKTRIELFRREIADISVRRAFAVISLSLVAIGVGILFLTKSDPDKDLLSIAFECFSAYCTVGLSLGITAHLSDYGKLVIMALMFIGRVSMLSIMIAIFNKVKHKNYRYPSEEIIIN
jgi:Trk-type K+ transport system membrane component